MDHSLAAFDSEFRTSCVEERQDYEEYCASNIHGLAMYGRLQNGMESEEEEEEEDEEEGYGDEFAFEPNYQYTNSGGGDWYDDDSSDDGSFMPLGGAFTSMGANTNANTSRPPVRTTMPPAGAFLPMGGAYMPPAGTFMPTAINRAFTPSSREERVRRGGGIDESSQYYIDGMNELYQDYLADIGY